MANTKQVPAEANRVLVKLRPSNALRAAESRANLRPLYGTARATTAAFGFDAAPQWFLAELPDGAVTPWDLAHARIAAQLGVAESDVIFVEPDFVHRDVYQDVNEQELDQGFAAADKGVADPQDGTLGKALGPDEFAWHLGDNYTQLRRAREAVAFSEPRTRIAHIDTGYYRSHDTAPEHVLRSLERSFVEGDADRHSAEDPDNRLLVLDNSGHGTGTIGILAGGKATAFGGDYLGGAPGAAVLPLRVADRVVLPRTSALAQALRYAVEQRCDVVSLSMGGWPSRAWAEAVDEAYEAGLCICAAAGNHIGVTPPHVVVYPARYSRVIAVCGVMANNRPYTGLKGTALEGSFGPDSAMKAAIAAYTPNIPWPRFMHGTVIRLNGEGTSAATPQVAAAAALWFEKYKHELPRDWRRVEAVRNALFTSAKLKADKKHFGNGVLQAHAALNVKPISPREPSERSDGSWGFLRILTGLGVVEAPPRELMFNLEIEQRWMVNKELQKIVPDPASATEIDLKALRRFMEAVIEDEGASLALRKHIAARYPATAGGKSAPRTKRSEAFVPDDLRVCDVQPTVQNPPYRRVRVYAVDPSFSVRLDTVKINDVALKVRWEQLQKGPVGEYLAVDDLYAPNKRYDAVDLDDPRLLAQDGWAPSERNPQFHQQMVYAVAMKTIEHFERALGRPVFWRPRPNPENPYDDSQYVAQLAVRPHALNQANAFYSKKEVALLFGSFEASSDDPGNQMPGGRVYSCLSHDIIAHETTHAILDGLYRSFDVPTNLDVLALREGFADIVALMQHFTIREVLEQEIAQTRGDIEAQSMLGSLAVQFGQATGRRGALRNAIGRMENNVWKRIPPDPADYQKHLTPHPRGAILVAAVFDAFIAIYKTRTADLLRIYTEGTGVLPSGAIHPDLVHRLADEAAKSAGQVLNMCIRALDYLAPVDVTFFEFLRALITADFDVVSDDRLNYRVAFVEAFRRRGIYPIDLGAFEPDTPRTLSPDTLRWPDFDQSQLLRSKKTKLWSQYDAIMKAMRRYLDDCFYVRDRETLFKVTREHRRRLHGQLQLAFKAVPEFAEQLGIDPRLRFGIHELRQATRVGPDSRPVPQLIIALSQSRVFEEEGRPRYILQGGTTLVADLLDYKFKYRIVKSVNSKERQERTAAYLQDIFADPLRALLFSPYQEERFAALHAFADDSL